MDRKINSLRWLDGLAKDWVENFSSPMRASAPSEISDKVEVLSVKGGESFVYFLKVSLSCSGHANRNAALTYGPIEHFLMYCPNAASDLQEFFAIDDALLELLRGSIVEPEMPIETQLTLMRLQNI